MSALTSASPFGSSSSLSGGMAADFPSPWADYASLVMPSDIRTVLRWCLHPDTNIITQNFVLKAIKDMVPGDSVLTKSNTWSKVETVSQRPVDENIICIQTDTGKVLKLTGNHKVPILRLNNVLKSDFTAIKEVCAQDIYAGDYVIYPYSAELLNSGILAGEFIVANNFICQQIVRVSKEKYQGFVYNLAVAGEDHSYTTDICVAFGIAK